MSWRLGRKWATGASTTLAALLTAALVLVLGGCGSNAGPGLGAPHFVVSQLGSGITDPLAISVAGLQAGQSAVLAAAMDTPTGTYRSRAVFVVPPDGTVALWNAHPLLAPYAEPDPAGLVWTLDGPPQTQGQLEATWADRDSTIRFTATQNGRQVAATSVRRTGFAHRVSTQAIFAGDLIRSTSDGSPGETTYDVRIGTFYDPVPVLGGRRPAVVLIDGDDAGGTAAFAAAQLAVDGYATFVVPAFGPEGQIPGSSALSVESFDLAISWLRLQPDVDAGRIFTYGTWRASQLALWFAADEPDKVFGAIAASGTTALLCTSTAGTAVLTQNGRPVPCEAPGRPIADTAQLRLDRIPGPILLACGKKDDELADACDWLAAGKAVRGNHPGDVFFGAAGAGHSISTVPLVPVGLQGMTAAMAQATEDARITFWAHVAELLRTATTR